MSNLFFDTTYLNLKSGKTVTKDNFESFLKEASDFYHTHEGLISDDEFDYFKQVFIDTYKYNPVEVGTKKGLKGFSKVRHEIPMGSLEEFDITKNIDEEIQKWIKKYAVEDLYCVSEKLDGISVSCSFEKGKLIQALTRGDGNEGDDITRNVLKMNKGRLAQLPYSFTGFLRGEIVLHKSTRKEYFPDFANERNGAGGLTKRLDGEGCDKLNVYCYKVYTKERTFATETEILNFIKNDLDTPTPRFYQIALKTLMALHKRYETEVREKLDYLLDGLVVNIDNVEQQNKILENVLLPEYARKFKFVSEMAETELLQVRPQVGRTGAITPLAILEPVICGGTLISKATLHNYDEIERLGVEAGDIVMVVRSKDVIPKIVKVVRKNDYSQKIIPPKECPECGSKVEKEDTIYYCKNDFCGARLSKALLHWLNILNIKSIGDKLIDALIDCGKLKSIPDFYRLQLEDIYTLERQGEKNATKVLREINDKKEITIAELLAGLNIRNLSVKRAEMLEDNFGSLENIINLKTKDIMALEGFEETLATFITTGLKAKKPLIEEILKYVKIKTRAEGVLTGKIFCFSGFRDPKIEDQIVFKGGRVSESFSKKINYLIVKNKDTTTSKIKKAKEYGTIVLDLNDLDSILHNTLF